jgi:hypothetical protein
MLYSGSIVNRRIKMSPNDVVAIKLLARRLKCEPRGYNPIENSEQAEDVAKHFGLRVENYRVATGWAVVNTATHIFDVYDERGLVARFNNFSKAKAIVYAAAKLIDPEWDQKRLFGIDFRFNAKDWKDAAGK